MTRKKYLEFANFICRFGEDKVLLDLAQEIVVPAFISRDLERSIKNSKYFFLDVQLIELHGGNNPVLGIVGRFVKDTILSREQIFDANNSRLISDKQEIQSSPSSIFALILNNHRLLYLHETQYAPSLASFQATIKSFIKQKHHDFLQNLYEENYENQVSKKALLTEFPYPSIEVIPLASGASLEDFINQFAILQNVTIKLLATNNEIDNNGFFELIRQSSDELGSKNTTLEYRNNKEGLDKDAAALSLKAAVNQGSSRINLKGRDFQGETLAGNNDNFKIYVPISDISKNVVSATKQMFSLFQEYVNKGLIYDNVNQENTDQTIRLLQDYVSLRDDEKQ